MHWAVYALLSAVFAGMTAVLAKIGIKDTPSNVATLVRTGVILIFAAGIVAARGQMRFIPLLTQRTWLFLVLSGVATGLSWLCYFAALKAGPVATVTAIDKFSFVVAMILAFVVLRERFTPLTLVGAALISLGILLTLPSVQERLGAWHPEPPPPTQEKRTVE